MAYTCSANEMNNQSRHSTELRPRNKEEDNEEIFSPRLLATYFFDLAYEVEEELWNITRMKGKFKSRKHCSRLALCQERAFTI